MPTHTRPQVVATYLESAGVDSDMIFTSLEVTKTATMTHGTILKADATEAIAADLPAAAVYVIDDLLIDQAETGDVVTVRAVEALDWVKFYGANLKLGSTALSAGELTSFAKKYA